MANTRTYNRSFAGGEISPQMYGRLDDAKFQTGAAKMLNMIATPTGAASNRPGFAYVNSTKNNGVARLIPFTYNLNQTMVIEIGAGYFRFHTMGQTLVTSVRWFLQSASCTISIASPGVVSLPGHDFANGDQMVFTTTGALPTGLTAGTVYYVVNSLPNAGTFQVAATLGGGAIATSGTQSGAQSAAGYYNPGDVVITSGGPLGPGFGLKYQCILAGSGNPLSNPTYWTETGGSAFGTPYEVASPYAAADLFNIHYIQSMDVMTLVHPNYPPAELSRVSATEWTYAAIDFGPPLPTPAGVGVAASPGYLAKIASVTNGTSGNALITTVSNHTLALGDGVYLQNLTDTPGSGPPIVLDGFYMVALVPVDGTGNLIPDELYLMDYSGNNLTFDSGGSYSTGGTIQYGTKIYNITNYYAVAAIASDGVSTSALSATVSVLNNLDVPGSFNTITWDAVDGTQSYNVYKQENGLWGFIGNTTALTFADNNIAPDMSITPGTPDAVFSGAGNYPGAVTYFQQRRCFAGTNNAPNNAWMSNSGTESMFSYSLPSEDTDRIAFQVAALKADVIQHMVPMIQLILLTSESEFALTPGGTNAITPSTVSVSAQSYVGASNVQPTIINVTMVYAAARGGHVRELGYAWTVNGYMTGDLSLRAAHLFDNFTIVDQAYSKSPYPIVWFVSSSGKLLGLTYIPEEQLGAWHQHTTQGTFESIACVAEGNDDVLYAVINRTIGGATVRYIEQMQPLVLDAVESLASASQESDEEALEAPTTPVPSNAFFVDAGATFNGTNTTMTTVEISGGTTWGPADTLTLTGSAAIFAVTDPDGSIMVFTDPVTGKNYRLTILTSSGTLGHLGATATARADNPIPADLQGAATTAWAWARPTIGGMIWLSGQTVAVLADGGVQAQKVVNSFGVITLDAPAVVVNVGLPYISDLMTLPAVLQLDGYGQGRAKNINKAWLKVVASSGIFVGPDSRHLTEIPQRRSEPWGSPPALQTAELEILTTASWQAGGQTLIRQQNPLPLLVTGLTMEVAIGG